MRTKNNRAAAVSRIPRTPHKIQEGKNDPRILKVGARVHPAANSMGAHEAAMAMARFMRRPDDDRKT
jgi:hypothetical protein